MYLFYFREPPAKGCSFYVQCDFTDSEMKYIGSTAIYELDEADTPRSSELITNANETNEDEKRDLEESYDNNNKDSMERPMLDNGLKLYNRNAMNGTNILNFFGGYDDSRILVFRERSVFRLKNYKGTVCLLFIYLIYYFCFCISI